MPIRPIRYILLLLLALLVAAPGLKAQDTAEADDNSTSPFITGDGSRVFFTSQATNLPAPGQRAPDDIFVYDRAAGQVQQVVIPGNDTVFAGGANLNRPSGDGRFVPFQSWIDAGGQSGGLFLLDRVTGTIDALNVTPDGNPGSGSYPYEFLNWAISVTDDGRWALFLSTAPDLVDGDENGSAPDLFLRDREAGVTTRVIASGPDENDFNSFLSMGMISGDGSAIAFSGGYDQYAPGDTNGTDDIFRYDSATGNIALVSHTPQGISGNGRSYVVDDISPDGRFILFESDASDLVPDDTNGKTDIFLYDHQTGVVDLVSRGDGGGLLDDNSIAGGITADGRYVVFTSLATNVLSGIRTDRTRQIYLRDRVTGDVALVSHIPGGGYPAAWSISASISDDGRFIAFDSDAADLVPGDTNGKTDVFLYDTEADTITRISVPNG